MSDLDGATEPGPEGAYPGTPGEFAAQWNSWTEERRADWLARRIRHTEAAQTCWIENHPGRIEQANERTRLAMILGIEAAQDRLVREDQFTERTLTVLDELAAEYRQQ